jgi:predicted ATPase
MAPPLNADEGYASPRLRATLERSAQLAEQLGDERLHLVSLVGLFAVRYVQGDIAESYRIAERALELGAAHPDVVGQAHFALGGAGTSLGRHEEGIEHLEKAHELSLPHPPSLVGTRPEVHARAWCAHPLWLLGRDEEALQWCEWAIERAEAVGHPYSVAVALSYAGITHQLRRDRDRTAEFSARSRELCTRHGFAYYREWSSVLGGWSLGGHAGADQIELGLRALRLQGALARQPYYMGLFAETLLEMGQGERAHGVLDGALAAAAEHQDRWWLPELHRLKSRLVSGEASLRHLRLAREIATEHGSVALLARLDEEESR